ncbi:MAG: branched-chain amino acid ABC transporter permease [Deltaproteobacteria bacterium CG23_combo_of_CG06-09_8_20_14_all_51_20]|nr:MAG: branched-chain amino acid ABC transporter permease [Deltaproteobacteria bacterium CG23_combo_of_CG06-09_8_20_14_all_51_20]
MRPCGIFDRNYGQDMAIIRTWQHWTSLLGALVILYLFPLFGSYYLVSFINLAAISVIAVLGLQIVSGYCGQISFGQAAFMAVGAYTSSVLTTHFGVSFWLALPLSGVVAGAVGAIGGAPSLRIKGMYLAMATIAIHFVLIWLVLHLEITGSFKGLYPPSPTLGGFEFDTDEKMFYIIVSVMLIMTYCARNLVRTRVGRAFVAIRDNDLAGEVMGINLYYYKLLAFFISCFYAGIAGSLWAHLITVVNAEQFTLLHALEFVGMLIIGGMGSIPGVFFGVLFIKILNELVLFTSPVLAGAFPWLGSSPAAAMGLIAFGLAVSIFLIFEPRGLAHRWEIFKASYRLYPFAN